MKFYVKSTVLPTNIFEHVYVTRFQHVFNFRAYVFIVFLYIFLSLCLSLPYLLLHCIV